MQTPRLSPTSSSLPAASYTHSHLTPTGCTPEQLYLHVVGHWPGPEVGYPAEASSVAGPSSSFSASTGPVAAMEAIDQSGLSDAAHAAAARSRKRRKVQRRAKVSEIWFPRAEMAFCTCVAYIPPNGRTKIKFFGRSLGRNELIAAICTLSTRRLYNRKQISSHSQVLKDKVPTQYKEIFTFEDKIKGPDDSGESASANTIENYAFPDAIYNVIGYPVGTDLANTPKPAWLAELEGGSDALTPVAEPSTPRGYSHWSAQDYPSYHRDVDQGYKLSDSDGLSGSGHTTLVPASASSVPSPLDIYPFPLASSHSALSQPSLPPPYGLAPPSLSHSRDHEPPPPQSASSVNESLPANRFAFAGHQPHSQYRESTSIPRSLPRSQSAPHPRILTGSSWDRVGVSPATSSSSAFDHSPGGVLSPPHQSSWADQKPFTTALGVIAGAGPRNAADHITLPPLQAEAPRYHSEWKDRATSWGAPPPSPRSLSSIAGIPASSNPYGLVLPPAPGLSGPSSAEFLPRATPNVRSPDNKSLAVRAAPFMPVSIEMTAQTADQAIVLSSADPIVNISTIPWNSIYMWEARYPFLETMAKTQVSIPVFHMDVPLSLPGDHNERVSLIERVLELGIRLALRPMSHLGTGYSITNDPGFVYPRGTMRYTPTTTQLRYVHSSNTNDTTVTARSGLTDFPRLYELFVKSGRDPNGGDSLASVGAPMSILVQRVMRDNDLLESGGHHSSSTGIPISEERPHSEWAGASLVIIYSFWITDDEIPTAQRQIPMCRLIDFSVTRQSDNASTEQLAMDLLAGEDRNPSKFDWL